MERLSSEAQILVDLLNQSNLSNGPEECVYNIAYQCWQPINLLPYPLKRPVEIGNSCLDPAAEYTPEAFSYNPLQSLTHFNVSFIAKGKTPRRVGIYHPPSLKPEELYYDDFKPRVNRIKRRLKELERKHKGGQIRPTIDMPTEVRPQSDCSPDAESPNFPIITRIYVSKFQFWRTGNYLAKTGEDKRRCLMTIVGAPESLDDENIDAILNPKPTLVFDKTTQQPQLLPDNILRIINIPE